MQIKKNLIISVLSCFVAIVLCEAVVRGVDLAPELHRLNPGLKKSVFRFSSNPLLGYVFQENYRDNDSSNLRNKYPYINANGQRDIERGFLKPPGVKRILLLGDSVVAGAVFINDLNDTISRQMEELFLDKNVEVLNFGINGYCTRGEVELLKVKGLKYEPDVVVMVFVQNDYFNINGDIGTAAIIRPKAIEFLFVYSEFFRLLSLRLDLFEFKKEFGINRVAGSWLGKMNQSDIDRIKSSEDATVDTLKKHLDAVGENNVEDGIKMFKELSRQYDFQPVLAIWPHFFNLGVSDVETFYGGKEMLLGEGQELMVEKIAKKYGVHSFRLSSYFSRDYEERSKQGGDLPNVNALYAGDSMHPSVLGAGVAAKALKNEIEKLEF